MLKIGSFKRWTIYLYDSRSFNHIDINYWTLLGGYNLIRTIVLTTQRQLNKIGIPLVHTKFLICDLMEETNNITGGGIGGEFDKKKHNISINQSEINISTFSHEYAHYIWQLLPKYKKKLVIDYYEDIIMDEALCLFQTYANINNLNKPSGSHMRKKLASKLKLPNSYCTANYHEFWATIIEKFVANPKKFRKKYPDLRKLVLDVL